MPSRLTANQFVRLAAMGVFYWFVAAQFVRLTAAGWVGHVGLTIFTFLLIVVVTVPALWVGCKIAAVDRPRWSAGAAVMTATALLSDGIAITWFRGLYGTDPATVLGGAAAILWGAGVALVLGMALERDR